MGHDFRDYICPDSVERSADHIKLGEKFARVLFLKDYASYIKDSMLSELTELNRNLMLFFTGFSRFSSDIQKTTQKDMADKERQLLEMLSLVDEAEKVLATKTDLNEFGRLLDYTWKLKRGISSGISTDSIDGLYAKGIEAGALGGKLLGAGGGGFLLFYVEEDKREAVAKAMEDLLYVPFQFENSGTRVIHYTAEMYEKR
mgnify:CR=1 FL=1